MCLLPRLPPHSGTASKQPAVLFLEVLADYSHSRMLLADDAVVSSSARHHAAPQPQQLVDVDVFEVITSANACAVPACLITTPAAESANTRGLLGYSRWWEPVVVVGIIDFPQRADDVVQVIPPGISRQLTTLRHATYCQVGN